jgi:hypothetical protein
MGNAIVVIGEVFVHSEANGFERRERENEEPQMFE